MSINAIETQEMVIIDDLSTRDGLVMGVIDGGCVTIRDFNAKNARPIGIISQDSIETRICNAN